MGELTKYIGLISKRGDAFGSRGGILDLLNWCGKVGVMAVTEEEARIFWEKYPDVPPHKSENK